ncbi:MAG: CTP-dependent riboflavin kinase [Desulfurococcales archaeon]|nr:CTP-dependent riboflavin kinase [Desulfurococcales archaeon]
MGFCAEPFKGTVFSGIGEGGFYVSIYSKGFRHTLGITPYPGTLNVRVDGSQVDRLKKCLNEVGGVRVDPPPLPDAKLAPVLVYPARIGHVDAFIVKPQITVYKDDVVEFISEVYIRGALKLQDGDKVEFEVLPWREERPRKL